jgi:GNAT superfamily N-acetyltransferase
MGAVNFLQAKEPFDEHAALILNLNCYGVVCAFSSASFDPLNRLVVEDDLENIRNEQIQRDICPWWNSNQVRVSSSDFYIRPIASALEDGQVRDLYARLYSHLFDSYPSIRKMVKSALKSDLGLVKTHIEVGSTIRNRYKLKGGDFWIASDIDGRVVGCIGLCLREENRSPSDKNPQIISSLEPTNIGLEYEIQRLCVDEQYRGKGLGSALLSNVEQWVRIQHKSTTLSKSVTYVAVNIKAVTPDCLTAANRLYDSAAYVKEETFHSGNIIMNVYYKTIQLQ